MVDNQHVVPHEEGWAVKAAGSARATKVHPIKAKAIWHAHSIAEKHDVHVVIHDDDGTVEHVDTPPHFISYVSQFL